MPLALWFIGFLFGIIQWYKKYIEPDLELRLSKDLKTDWEGFIQRLLRDSVEIEETTDQESGEVHLAPRLKQGFELSSLRDELAKITVRHRSALDVEKRMERLNFIQEHFVWLFVMECSVVLLQFIGDKFHPFECLVSNPLFAIDPKHLAWIKIQIDSFHNILTVVIIGTTAYYVFIFLRIYNYGKLKWQRR